MRGRKPYIPHRHPELLGRRRLWEGGDDDWDFPVVFVAPRGPQPRPSYVNVTVAVDQQTFRVYEDPEEEMLVIESPRGSISLRELEELIGARTVSCQCGSSFGTLAAALEHAAGERHTELSVV